MSISIRTGRILLFLLPVILSGTPTAEEYFKKAFEYYQKGEISRAIEFYRKTLELEPENLSAYHNLGLAYAERKEYGRAIKNFKKVIALKVYDYFIKYDIASEFIIWFQHYNAAIGDN